MLSKIRTSVWNPVLIRCDIKTHFRLAPKITPELREKKIIVSSVICMCASLKLGEDLKIGPNLEILNGPSV